MAIEVQQLSARIQGFARENEDDKVDFRDILNFIRGFNYINQKHNRVITRPRFVMNMMARLGIRDNLLQRAFEDLEVLYGLFPRISLLFGGTLGPAVQRYWGHRHMIGRGAVLDRWR